MWKSYVHVHFSCLYIFADASVLCPIGNASLVLADCLRVWCTQHTTALLPMPSHALSMYNIRSVATKFSSEPNLTRILKDPQEHEQQQHWSNSINRICNISSSPVALGWTEPLEREQSYRRRHSSFIILKQLKSRWINLRHNCLREGRDCSDRPLLLSSKLP